MGFNNILFFVPTKDTLANNSIYIINLLFLINKIYCNNNYNKIFGIPSMYQEQRPYKKN